MSTLIWEGQCSLGIGDVIVLVTIDVGKGNFDRERGSQLVDAPDEVHMLNVN